MIRPYCDSDRAEVLALADRLTVGDREWRDPAGWLAAVRGWVSQSVAAAVENGHAVYVAGLDPRTAGFVMLGTRAPLSRARPTRTSESWSSRTGPNGVVWGEP